MKLVLALILFSASSFAQVGGTIGISPGKTKNSSGGSTPAISSGFIMGPIDHGAFINGQDAWSNNVATPYFERFITKGYPLVVNRVSLRFSGGTASGTAGTAFAIYTSSCVVVAKATSRILDTALGEVVFTFASPPTLSANTSYVFGFATQQLAQLWYQYNALGPLRNTSGGPVVNFTSTNAATGTGASLLMPDSCATGQSASANYPLSFVLWN